MTPRLDPAFQKLLPPLSSDELAELEASIIDEGVRDPLIVWRGILLDGHNRLVIAEKHGFPYRTQEVELEDRDAAEDWIIANQLGRRNISENAARALRGYRYEREKKSHGGDRRSSPHREDLKTAERLSGEYGISRATIERDGAFARDLEAVVEVAGEEVRKVVLARDSKLGPADLKRLAEVAREAPEALKNLPTVLNPGVARIIKAKHDEKRILSVGSVEGKYKTIVVDPPWDHEGFSLAGRGAPEYAVMTHEELLALPVADWAEENSHLYLWTTNNFIMRAGELMASWGFDFKTILTWIKPNIGLGSYFRNNTEHVLFGVRGTLPTRAHDIRTAFNAPLAEHSKKPDEFFALVEQASYPPYLEAFSRSDRDGWSTWG